MDLKPENILISEDGLLRISDFGLSRNAKSDNYGQFDREGDKVYMAPEVLDGIFSPLADIFSLGLMLLELSTDMLLPSNGDSWHEIRSGSYLSTFHNLEFGDIIQKMIDPVWNRRPTAQDLLLYFSRYTNT